MWNLKFRQKISKFSIWNDYFHMKNVPIPHKISYVKLHDCILCIFLLVKSAQLTGLVRLT